LPAAACPALPSSGCRENATSRIIVKDRAGGDRDQIKWKWLGGDEFTFLDLGDPRATTAYRVCIYDEGATQTRLATSLNVEPNADWVSRSGRGWYYKDRDAVADGIVKLQAVVGRRSKLLLTAKGAGVPTPGPWAASRYFEQADGVIVQLVAQSPWSAPVCWSARFADAAKRNDAELFKAKAR
jgi:hypothetical protein